MCLALSGNFDSIALKRALQVLSSGSHMDLNMLSALFLLWFCYLFTLFILLLLCLFFVFYLYYIVLVIVVTIIGAAGDDNKYSCNVLPASSRSIIITASTSKGTDFELSGSNFGECINIFAPGDGILTVTTNFHNNVYN